MRRRRRRRRMKRRRRRKRRIRRMRRRRRRRRMRRRRMRRRRWRRRRRRRRRSRRRRRWWWWCSCCRHSVHVQTFLCISVPPPSQFQSRLQLNYTSSFPSPTFCYGLNDGCPTPTHGFSHHGSVTIFVCTLKNAEFLWLGKPIFGTLNQIMWDTRTQLHKTHNTGKTGMNGIPWDVVTSKAIHSTVSEVVRSFFLFW